MTQTGRSVDPFPKRGAAARVFPDLWPPTDQIRAEPVAWQDAAATPPLQRFAKCVVALLAPRRAAPAPHAAVNDRNKAERGSGSW